MGEPVEDVVQVGLLLCGELVQDAPGEGRVRAAGEQGGHLLAVGGEVDDHAAPVPPVYQSGCFEGIQHGRGRPGQDPQLEGQLLDPDRTAEAVVEGITGIAANLDLTVTIEGIEERRAADRARELGCHLGQGFLWPHGLTAAELP